MIAESRIAIEQVRLLVLKTAWLIDTVGNKGARPRDLGDQGRRPPGRVQVIDRAIQVHGGAGVCQDIPAGADVLGARTLRIADGPDEVHKMTIARRELRRFEAGRSG